MLFAESIAVAVVTLVLLVFSLIVCAGMFLTFFLLFARFFPTVAMSEVKGVIPTKQGVVRVVEEKGEVEGKEVSHA